MKPLVMDLGMHNGNDTAYYLSQGCRVVAVDADPQHVANARARFAKEIASGDLVIEECGITATDGERVFYRSPRVSEWSSFDFRLAARNGTEKVDAFLVRCRSPWFLFDEYETAHYMKIDLEGNDKCVLAVLAQLPADRLPRYLSTEVMVVSDIDMVAMLGYTEFCVVDQSRYLGKGNPSGPFGEHLAGPWVSAAEAAAQYTAGLTGPASWFDVHARMA